MNKLERILSRPVAKPYRSSRIHSDTPPLLDDKGLLAFGPNDVENPRNWSRLRRWYITAIVIVLVVNATFASSGPSGSIHSIAQDLHVSNEAAGLVITLFLLGYCAGPLIWAPLSEFYGRRWIFYGTFVSYTAFNFLCAFTPNFAGLLVGRFLTGTFASAAISNSPGVLADIWGPVDRGNALALFSMFTLIGPAIGPVISGFLELTRDWRWNFYVLLWLASISLCCLLTIPETLPSQVLLNKARRLRRIDPLGYQHIRAPVEATDRTLAGLFKVALIRPWQIIVDPIAFLVAIYLSIAYTLLYMLFAIYPIIFQEKHGWNAGVGQLPLLGVILGSLLAGAVIFTLSNKDKARLLADPSFAPTPESRLPPAMVGGIMFPIAMFWFSWSGEYESVHWAVPTIAGVFLTASILLVFVAYLNYLTDCYLFMAASAIAGNTVARSACAAASPLFTTYMFDTLGVGPGGSLIGGVAILLAPIPFVFYKYGKRIRVRSKFAPTAEVETADAAGSQSAPQHDVSQIAIDGEKEPDVEKGIEAKSSHSLTGRNSRSDRASSRAGLEDEALAEEAGVPAGDVRENGAAYIDAHGFEKAETPR